MSDFKYFIEKHKQKILVTISLLILIGVGFGIFKLIKNAKNNKPNEEIINVVDNSTEFVFVLNKDNQINLVNTRNTVVVDTLRISENKNLYSKSENLDKLYVLVDKTIYVLEEDDGMIKSTELIKIDIDKVNSFEVNDKYIALATENKVTVYSLNDKKVFLTKNIDNLKEWTLKDDNIIYTDNTKLKELNLTKYKDFLDKKVSKDDSLVEVELGGNTTLINTFNNDELIVFNNFGKDVNKYSYFNINPENLYVNAAYSNANSDVTPIKNDSDDTSIYFIENINKDGLEIESLISIELKDGKETKSKASLTSPSNDVKYKDLLKTGYATKGYAYFFDNNVFKILDIRGETVNSNIVVDFEVEDFMPIVK